MFVRSSNTSSSYAPYHSATSDQAFGNPGTASHAQPIACTTTPSVANTSMTFGRSPSVSNISTLRSQASKTSHVFAFSKPKAATFAAGSVFASNRKCESSRSNPFVCRPDGGTVGVGSFGFQNSGRDPVFSFGSPRAAATSSVCAAPDFSVGSSSAVAMSCGMSNPRQFGSSRIFGAPSTNTNTSATEFGMNQARDSFGTTPHPSVGGCCTSNSSRFASTAGGSIFGNASNAVGGFDLRTNGKTGVGTSSSTSPFVIIPSGATSGVTTQSSAPSITGTVAPTADNSASLHPFCAACNGLGRRTKPNQKDSVTTIKNPATNSSPFGNVGATPIFSVGPPSTLAMTCGTSDQRQFGSSRFFGAPSTNKSITTSTSATNQARDSYGATPQLGCWMSNSSRSASAACGGSIFCNASNAAGGFDLQTNGKTGVGTSAGAMSGVTTQSSAGSITGTVTPTANYLASLPPFYADNDGLGGRTEPKQDSVTTRMNSATNSSPFGNVAGTAAPKMSWFGSTKAVGGGDGNIFAKNSTITIGTSTGAGLSLHRSTKFGKTPSSPSTVGDAGTAAQTTPLRTSLSGMPGVSVSPPMHSPAVSVDERVLLSSAPPCPTGAFVGAAAAWGQSSADALLAQKIAAIEIQVKQLALLKEARRGTSSIESPSPRLPRAGTINSSPAQRIYGAACIEFPSFTAPRSSLPPIRRSAVRFRPRGFGTCKPIRESPNAYPCSAAKNVVIRPSSRANCRALRLFKEGKNDTATPLSTRCSSPLKMEDDIVPCASASESSSGEGTGSTKNKRSINESAAARIESCLLRKKDKGAEVATKKAITAFSLVPKLTKSGYSVFPSLDSLSIMSEAELTTVRDFTVSRPGYGSVSWDGDVDVRGVDIDSVVCIEDRGVAVYDDYELNGKKPSVGSKLNRSAVVTLFGVFPKIGPTAHKNEVKNFERKIAKRTVEMGAELISYCSNSGEWRFRVHHFSRYETCSSREE